MKIKIVEANRVAINALLDKINGKSYSHTAFHKHIFDLAKSSELQLNKFDIAKKYRSGAIASGMSGGNVPTAKYKYSRVVNTYIIERGAEIVHYCYLFVVRFSELQRVDKLQRLLHSFFVD